MILIRIEIKHEKPTSHVEFSFFCYLGNFGSSLFLGLGGCCLCYLVKQTLVLLHARRFFLFVQQIRQVFVNGIVIFVTFTVLFVSPIVVLGFVNYRTEINSLPLFAVSCHPQCLQTGRNLQP